MSDVVLVAVIAAVPGTVTAIFSIVLAYVNKGEISVVKTKQDGQSEEILRLTKRASYSVGAADQRKTDEPL